MANKKSIIFDLGGVYFTDGTRRAVDAVARRYNIEPSRVRHYLTGEIGRQYRSGQISAETFWEQARRYWGIDAATETLAAIWLDGYEPIAGTVALVDKLAAANYRLLFLSDNTPERVAYLDRRYGFLAKFDDGIFSYAAGYVKPDPRLYRQVLEKAARSPHDCIYIDDRAELLAPARALGMQVIAFQNPAQLEERLRGLGVLTA